MEEETNLVKTEEKQKKEVEDKLSKFVTPALPPQKSTYSLRPTHSSNREEDSSLLKLKNLAQHCDVCGNTVSFTRNYHNGRLVYVQCNICSKTYEIKF